jgi:HK97 family phage prohead protease
MSAKLERRILATEFRTVKSGKATKLVGYAAVFNCDSEDLGGFIERIAPGAFTDVLASNPDTRCLFNHDPNSLLGRTKSGTLVLSQDSTGLSYSCDVADTQCGRDVLTLAERGDLTQSSFAFRVDPAPGSQKWFDAAGKETDMWSGVRRVIYRIAELADVSPVTTPAYPDASVSARSAFLFPEGRDVVDGEQQRARAKNALAILLRGRAAEAESKRQDELKDIAAMRRRYNY